MELKNIFTYDLETLIAIFKRNGYVLEKVGLGDRVKEDKDSEDTSQTLNLTFSEKAEEKKTE